MACSQFGQAEDYIKMPAISVTTTDNTSSFNDVNHPSTKSSYSKSLSVKKKTCVLNLEVTQRRASYQHIIPVVFVENSKSSGSPKRGHKSSQRRKSSVYDNYRKPSVTSPRSRSGSWNSFEYQKHRQLMERRPSVVSNARHSLSEEMTAKQYINEKQRRKIALVVVSTFLFILISSVAIVILTLTHQSEWTYDKNKTMTIYTFAPDSKVIIHEEFPAYRNLRYVNIVRLHKNHK